MAVDTSKIAFSSDFRYMRLATKGSVTLKDSQTTLTNPYRITHDLGYIPLVVLYAQAPDGRTYAVNGNTINDIDVTYSATTSYIGIDVFDNTFADRSITIYYRIYAEPVS